MLSQAMAFWVIALVFWYGSRLVANFGRAILQFFIGLVVSISSPPLRYGTD